MQHVVDTRQLAVGNIITVTFLNDTYTDWLDKEHFTPPQWESHACVVLRVMPPDHPRDMTLRSLEIMPITSVPNTSATWLLDLNDNPDGTFSAPYMHLQLKYDPTLQAMPSDLVDAHVMFVTAQWVDRGEYGDMCSNYQPLPLQWDVEYIPETKTHMPLEPNTASIPAQQNIARVFERIERFLFSIQCFGTPEQHIFYAQAMNSMFTESHLESPLEYLRTLILSFEELLDKDSEYWYEEDFRTQSQF